MRRSLIAIAAATLASAIALPAAAQAAAGETATKPAGVVALGEVKLSATVEGVDAAKRLLTLKGPAGNVETFEVDAAVKNLGQVKKGDVVAVSYRESLAYEVRRAGAAGPGVTAAGGVTTAKPGEKPALAAARQVTATVTITAIDAKIPTVTFKGPAGNERTIKVKDPGRLAGVKVGDTVDLVYTEALAVAVEPAPKK